MLEVTCLACVLLVCMKRTGKTERGEVYVFPKKDLYVDFILANIFTDGIECDVFRMCSAWINLVPDEVDQNSRRERERE